MNTKIESIRRQIEIKLENGASCRFDVIVYHNHIQRELDIIPFTIGHSFKEFQNLLLAGQQLLKFLEAEGTIRKTDEEHFEPNPGR